MRKKAEKFELEKKQFPAQIAQARKKTVARLMQLIKEARVTSKPMVLKQILNNNPMGWQQLKDLVPEVPMLNLCTEKQLLLMLQNDVRKVVPINSNHELWAVLQGQCKPIL